jgi:hypothetical protein
MSTSDMIPGQKIKLWLIKVKNLVFEAILDPPSGPPSAKSPVRRKLRQGLFLMYFLTRNLNNTILARLRAFLGSKN